MAYTYKYILDSNGMPVYPRTVLSAVHVITANGIQVNGDTISIAFATPAQIRSGAQGLVISADGLREAIATYSDALYVASNGIKIQGGTIGVDPATINEILTNSGDRTKAVTNANLNGALDVGRALDVTMPANRLYYSALWSSITTYTETTTTNGIQYVDDCIRLQVSSPSTTYYFYGWDPLPGFVTGRVYLLMCDEKIVSGRVRSSVGVNTSVSDHEEILDPNGTPIRGFFNGVANAPEMTSNWERLATCIKKGTPHAGLWFYAVTTTAIDIRVKHLRVFDVTDLSMETRYAIATMDHPEDLYGRYLVKSDEVCPWVETKFLSGSSVIVQPGLSYKLTATDGAAHTINVPVLPNNTYGKDAHITIILDNTSSIQAASPLSIVDALRTNAANNCVIKFRDGKARLYVDNIDYGYIVTVSGSGTANGTLYYGLFSTSEDYIIFSHATDNADCIVSTGNSNIPATTATTRAITGNGANKTIANFNNTQVKTTKSLTFEDITVKNATVSAGTVYVNNGAVGGVTVSGAVMTLSGDINLIGNITGSGIGITEGSSVHGTGTIDKVNNTGFNNVNFEGVNLTRGNTLYYTTNKTVKDCNITAFTYTTGAGIYVAGGVVNILNVTISGCTATNRCVIYVSGGTAYADSCVISNNELLSSPINSVSPGVLYITNSTISNNHVTSDMAGIGPFSYGTMTVENCVVSDNVSAGQGGGMVCNSGAHLYLRNSLITRNKANSYAGGFWSYTATTEMTGCTVSYNYASGVGGGVHLTGNATLTMDRCLITGNTSAGSGPGIYIATGASLVATNSIISNNNYSNTACRGSALCIDGTGTASLVDCVISGNTNPSASVFIYNGTGSATLTHCLITENITTLYDTVICSHMGNSVLTIVGCTVSNNRSATSNIIVAGATATLNAYNCLVTGNTATTNGAAFASHHTAYTFYIEGCRVENNVVGAGSVGRGGYFAGSNGKATIKDCYFGRDQDISIGSTTTVTITGSNVFRAGVNGSGSITFSSDAVVDLRDNPVTNAITGSTITAQGMLTIITVDGRRYSHLARAVTTGSTITNTGLWYPSPSRLIIPANTTASFKGYNLSNNSLAQQGVGINASAVNIDVDIYDTTINNNNSGSYQGSGVYTAGSSVKLSLFNCTITNCKIYPVYANNYSTINMQGCTVSGCSTTYDIVFAYNYSHLNAYDCLITNNTNSASGDMAIGAHMNSECNITACTVSYNWAHHCAGYHIAQVSCGTASRCLITGNTSTTGGGGAGMWLTGATMSLVQCTFTANVAAYGNGVCCNNTNCYLNITNCTFNDNQDIYCYTSNVKITLTGESKFKAAINAASGCIMTAADSVIDLSGNSVTNAVLGGTISALGSILSVKDKYGKLHQYQQRSVTGSTITNLGAWFPTPRLTFSTASQHAELTGTILNDYAITSNDYRAVRITGGSTTITLNNISVNRNSSDGNYYGMCIVVSGAGSVVTVNGGTFSGNVSKSEALIYVNTTATVYLNNILITGTSVTNPGRASVLADNANTTIYMNGCTVSDTIGWVDTGVFARYGGKLHLTDCVLSGITCSADTSTAVAYLQNSTMTLTRCRIVNNRVTGGFNAGIGSYQTGIVTVTDCFISGNRAATNGGGLFCGASSTMTVSGSTVVGNFANAGPLAFLQDNSTINFTGGNVLSDSIYISASSGQVPKLNFSGTNIFRGTITGNYNYALITISAGAVLNFTENAYTNAILGGTITALGAFTVIDKNGTSHSYSATTKTNSKITNLGVWS